MTHVDPGVKAVMTRRVDPEKVRLLTEAGWSAERIGVELGCNPRTVSRIRVRLGIGRPPRHPMTAEELEWAERLLADGCSVTEMERTLGRTEGALNRRYKGRGWTKQEVSEFAGACSRAARRMRAEGSWADGG